MLHRIACCMSKLVMNKKTRTLCRPYTAENCNFCHKIAAMDHKPPPVRGILTSLPQSNIKAVSKGDPTNPEIQINDKHSAMKTPVNSRREHEKLKNADWNCSAMNSSILMGWKDYAQGFLFSLPATEYQWSRTDLFWKGLVRRWCVSGSKVSA